MHPEADAILARWADLMRKNMLRYIEHAYKHFTTNGYTHDSSSTLHMIDHSRAR